MDETDREKLDRALRAALSAHRAALRRETDLQTRRFEQRFLLARLGFVAADLDAIAAAGSASALPPALLCRVETRLVAEARRLSRLARSGSARYDLNRHIAVRKALAWLRGPPAAPGDAADDRRSGHALNSSSFRSRHRDRPRRGVLPAAANRPPRPEFAPPNPPATPPHPFA